MGIFRVDYVRISYGLISPFEPNADNIRLMDFLVADGICVLYFDALIIYKKNYFMSTELQQLNADAQELAQLRHLKQKYDTERGRYEWDCRKRALDMAFETEKHQGGAFLLKNITDQAELYYAWLLNSESAELLRWFNELKKTNGYGHFTFGENGDVSGVKYVPPAA